MTHLSRRRLLGGAAGAALAGMTGRMRAAQQEIVLPAPLGPSIPPELLAPAGNWPVMQGNLAGTRNAVGSQLDSTNLARLEVAWEFPVEASTGYGGMTANPIVIDETVYLQDMLSNVIALDRATGELRWEHTEAVPTIGPNGVAVAYDRVFAAAGDTAEVFSLDAATGEELWRIRLTNNPREGIDMAPAVYDSTVYISTVAGNTRGFNVGGSRGILFALEAASGATLWQFDTTTDNLWGNPRLNSGGGLWYPPSFDNDGIYFGVGNAAPWPGTPDFPNGSSRPGPNDYASCMVALDRASGALRWHHNAAPHDLLDHDFQNTPLLLDVTIDSGPRKLAVGSGKTGTVVACDRESGEVVWQASLGTHQSDELAALPDEPVEIFPGAWGGVLTPLASDGKRIFVPIVNQRTRYAASKYDKMSMFDFADATGMMSTLDAGSGAIMWQEPLPSPAVGGATIVNDVVITAGFDGVIRLHSAENGAQIGLFSAGAGINAPPAVAGDLLVVPAAGPFFPGRDGGSERPATAGARVIALTVPGLSRQSSL